MDAAATAYCRACELACPEQAITVDRKAEPRLPRGQPALLHVSGAGPTGSSSVLLPSFRPRPGGDRARPVSHRGRPGEVHLADFGQGPAQLFRLSEALSLGQRGGGLKKDPGVPADVGVVHGAGGGADEKA
ncbi:hypothetical protein GCM10010524_07230 [Streptomyces mexicanus]